MQIHSAFLVHTSIYHKILHLTVRPLCCLCVPYAEECKTAASSSSRDILQYKLLDLKHHTGRKNGVHKYSHTAHNIRAVCINSVFTLFLQIYTCYKNLKNKSVQNVWMDTNYSAVNELIKWGQNESDTELRWKTRNTYRIMMETSWKAKTWKTKKEMGG